MLKCAKSHPEKSLFFQGFLPTNEVRLVKVAGFSRSGKILLADDDRYTLGTMLAPNRMELCHPMCQPPGGSHPAWTDQAAVVQRMDSGSLNESAE
jgi:hypothetical protein